MTARPEGQDWWQLEFELCERLHQTILSLISDRRRHPRSSILYSQLSEDISQNLAQLSSQIVALKQAFQRHNSSLTEGEVRRRESLIDKITRKEKELREMISRSNFNDNDQDRQALLGAAAGGPVQTVRWGEAFSSSRDTSIPMDQPGDDYPQSSQAMKMKQEEALADQDKGLDMLHSVILRQKAMAQQIGEEVAVQNDIIDDIDTRIDSTTQRLLENTENVRSIDRKDRTCGYWVIIVLLFIAIIVIALV